MKLTRAERKQAFAGTLKVLRRSKKPDQEAGHKVVLSETRGGKQVLFPGNDFESRRSRQKLLDEGKAVTVEIPRQPNLWLVLKGWHLRQGSTEWETGVTIHDFREPTRMLGPAPSPPTEVGLRTRSGTTVDSEGVAHPKKIAPKGKQTESFTAETERGYGGAGRSAIDEAAGVDDATLSDFARRVAEENALLKARKPVEADKQRKVRKAEEELRRANGSGARAAKRRAKRAERRQRAAA